MEAEKKVACSSATVLNAYEKETSDSTNTF